MLSQDWPINHTLVNQLALGLGLWEAIRLQFIPSQIWQINHTLDSLWELKQGLWGAILQLYISNKWFTSLLHNQCAISGIVVENLNTLVQEMEVGF